MKSCKNCLHKRADKRKEPCKVCYARRKWEHDGKPSPCDGCAFFGKYEVGTRHCYHCVDGSKWISPEVFEARKKVQNEWNM